MVFAHYMPWFRAEKEADGFITWDHWQWFGKGPKHDPDDIDEDGRRDIASVFYPLIGPYDGRDPDVLEYHFLTAKLAGIDGFIADWYGPGNYSDEVFAAMVRTAEHYGMKVAICLEEKSFFPAYSKATSREEVMAVAANQIRHVLNTHAGSPAYLRRNGDPVFFMFNNHENGALGSHILTHEEIKAVLDGIEEEDVLLVRGYLDMHYAGIARGGYLWCDSPSGRENFYKHVPEAREKGVEYIVGVANPGFDDSGVWGWGGSPRITDRRGTK
ncbi:MAG: hypothetical protein KJ626_11495 [Verrucomicrobia bacterium]|nr:hypothetical protein [Verrucomicrobiota bacterium]